MKKINPKYIFLLVAFMVLLLTLITHMTECKQNGDLFISLSGGRDIATGNLLKPDSWSFMTNGKVWTNWGYLEAS